MQNVYNNNVDNLLPNLGQGVEKKECDILNNLGLNVECQSQDVGKDMVDKKCITENFKLEIPRILSPSNYDNDENFLNDLNKWYTNRMGKSNNTFRKRRNLLKTMATHPIFPINIRNLNPDQIYTQFQYDKQNYNKNTNRNGKDAIINKMKCLKMVAQACNIDTKHWNIPIPKTSKPKHKIVPFPNIVYKIIHYKYSKDPYENALYSHIALHGFFIGPRPTSEMPIMTTDNIHIEEGYINFFQPKVQEWRMSPLENEIITLSTRKSLKNYIDKWRPKVVNQYSGNYLYLQPKGKPFTEQYFRKKINKMYKQVYPQFHPYNMRDWCAIARLIQTKINSNRFDIYEVYDWFEHSDISVTESYIKSTKRFYKLAPFDWIKAVLKSDINIRLLSEGKTA